MADTIERIYKLTVDGAQAARDLNAIAKSTQDAEKRFDAAAASIKKVAGALAAGFTVGTVLSSIKSNIDAMDELSKSVSKVGIAAEDLQKLRYAADLSGLSAEDLDKSIGKLAVSMADLETGTTGAHKALRAIGVQSGDSPVQALDKIADEFAKMPDGIEKTALAIEIFGKAGKDLIPLLNGGSAGLKELTDEAERYGVVLSGGTLKAAEAFNDNLSRLEGVMGGVMKQITAGLLPALQAISQSFVDSASTGDGFVETGDAIGEVLVNLTGVALKAGATLKAFGLVIGAVAAAAANPGQAGTIFTALVEDINALDRTTNEKLKKLEADYKSFRESTKAGAPQDTAGDGPASAALKAAAAAEALAKKQREADAAAAKALAARTKAIREHQKVEDEAWKQLAEQARIAEDAQKRADEALVARTSKLSAYEKAILEVDRAAEERLDRIEEEGARQQYLVDLLDETSDVYANATEAQRAYARSQLEVATTTAVAGETIAKQTSEVDVLTQGFENFFDNLASGTADVEDLFKRMVQSIIAELLKLWAKKYIIDALTNAFGGASGGGGGAAGRLGLAFDSGAVVPFAKGGVLTRPTTFPMALAGEAGPEAIMPLQRTASGDLGIVAQQPALNVTINNNAPVSVSTQQTNGGLTITIDEIKASLAADVMRGGNDFATAAERAWGLSRGSAAAF